MTAVTCRTLTTRKSRPNPLNRRMAERSVVGAGEQLPRLPPGVEAHRQCLEALVEVAAQLRLEPEHGVGLDPPAHEDEDGLEHPEREGEQAEGQHRRELVPGDRPVDDGSRHERDGDGEADAGERCGEHDGEGPAVRAQVAAQAPAGPEGGGRLEKRRDSAASSVTITPTTDRDASGSEIHVGFAVPGGRDNGSWPRGVSPACRRRSTEFVLIGGRGERVAHDLAGSFWRGRRPASRCRRTPGPSRP